ncbi:MAG: STAS domain-containing protein [candidate division Zixibacteria bacterium]|nr:STAS domain-containing protein [candidate division Zixibacteria bacterium]
MKLTSREEGAVVVLEPRGKIIGGPDATVLREQVRDLTNSGKKKIVIDLAGVDWMNSTGLGILISCLTTLRNSGGELKLARITEKIESLLTITKLVTVFDTYDSAEDAISAFSGD